MASSWTATVVNCTYLNVRSQPSASSKIVHVVNKGYSTKATKTKSGWYYLEAKKGWVSGTYLKLVATKAPAKTTKKTSTATAKKKATKKLPLDSKKYVSASQLKKSNAAAKKKLDSIKATSGKNYNISPMKIVSSGANSDVDITLNDSDEYALNAIHRNLSIYNNASYKDLFTKMNRFHAPVPDYPLNKAIPYIFFTRPGLRLYDTKDKLLADHENTYFDWMDSNHNLATRSLTTHLTSDHKFNPFLSNAAESFDLSDELIKTVEHGETYTGWKGVYARNTNESNTASQFSVSYTEDKKLTIYNMHKLWIDYMSQMQRGFLTPALAYLHKRIIDYACSVYYFLCANDGETLLYWAKYTGVFPLNTPDSAFSWAKGSTPSMPKFSINYSYTIREQMNPLILSEFNYLSRDIDASSFRSIYNDELNIISNGMVGMPFIQGTKVGDVGSTFRLRFREPQ